MIESFVELKWNDKQLILNMGMWCLKWNLLEATDSSTYLRVWSWILHTWFESGMPLKERYFLICLPSLFSSELIDYSFVSLVRFLHICGYIYKVSQLHLYGVSQILRFNENHWFVASRAAVSCNVLRGVFTP